MTAEAAGGEHSGEGRMSEEEQIASVSAFIRQECPDGATGSQIVAWLTSRDESMSANDVRQRIWQWLDRGYFKADSKWKIIPI